MYMITEKEIENLYNEQVEFLTECDKIDEDTWSLERSEAYDRAIVNYDIRKYNPEKHRVFDACNFQNLNR